MLKSSTPTRDSPEQTSTPLKHSSTYVVRVDGSGVAEDAEDDALSVHFYSVRDSLRGTSSREPPRPYPPSSPPRAPQNLSSAWLPPEHHLLPHYPFQPHPRTLRTKTNASARSTPIFTMGIVKVSRLCYVKQSCSCVTYQFSGIVLVPLFCYGQNAHEKSPKCRLSVTSVFCNKKV